MSDHIDKVAASIHCTAGTTLAIAGTTTLIIDYHPPATIIAIGITYLALTIISDAIKHTNPQTALLTRLENR